MGKNATITKEVPKSVSEYNMHMMKNNVMLTLVKIFIPVIKAMNPEFTKEMAMNKMK